MTTVRPSRLSTTATIAAPARPRDEVAGRTRWALWLSVLALALMLVSSVVGLAVDGLYGDPPSLAPMLRAYDLVTLAVVVPVLALSLLGVRRGSAAAQLVWVGMLASGVYTYALYLFPTAFNDAFLLHVAVFSASLFALVLAVSSLDVERIGARFGPRTPVRWIAALLAFLAVGLGGMWVANSVRFTVTGELPEGSALVETPAVTHLGYVLDLGLLVPLYAIAAALLWRRAGWGYVLAALALVAGTIQQFGYLVALVFQAAADVPGATAVDPLEPPIAMAFLVAAAVLLAGLRR